MIGDDRVLGIITARGGSKGLPGKNLIPFRGRPLIGWTIAAAQASVGIDRLILSSDDPGIIAEAVAFGCEAPFVRDAALSGDTARSIDVVLDALDRVPGYEVMVLLQPTSPLRTAADIDAVLAQLKESDSCVSVTEAETHPWLTYRTDLSGRMSPYAEPPAGASLRRQDLPGALTVNGAVYAARVDWLRRTRSFVVPGETRAHVMPPERSADIDTREDLDAAEGLAGH
ncbi:MAG: cytidylyltransferase domain-containing protein [Brevundimonas sp.]